MHVPDDYDSEININTYSANSADNKLITVSSFFPRNKD